MKKTYPALKIFIVAVFLVSVISCRKIIEEIKSNLFGSEMRNCRITQIVSSIGDGDSLHFLITYNSNGDPISIMQPATDLYELFWRKFYYNSNNQLSGTWELTDWLYGTTSYYYDSMGRIDSLHSSYGEDEELYTKFEYDSYNRIIKETRRLYFLEYYQGKTVITYSYDASGNLVGGSRPYDTKMSLLKTNKLWMYFARDYSVNNSQEVVSYNPTGFPTEFGGTHMCFVNDGLSTISLSASKIYYECE